MWKRPSLLPLAGLLVLVILLLGPASAAAQAVVELQASRDATLYEDAQGDLANGSGVAFHSGRTNNTGDLRRAVIAFNIGSIPAGSTITAVSLRLRVLRANDTVDPPSRSVALHRVTSSWTEGPSNAGGDNEGQGVAAQAGDVTWVHRSFDTLSWNTAGGDYVAAPSATTLVGDQGTNATWSGAGLVADVQAWRDGTAANHGWILVTSTDANGQARRYASRQNTTATIRPVLTVTYTPPPATGACCAVDGGCSQVDAPGTSCAGDYQGDGSTCEPDTCPQPTGACCLPVAAATCEEVTEEDCVAADGTFQGDFSACGVTECPVVLTPFVDPLPIPRVAVPDTGAPGAAAHYRMSAVEIDQVLHSELPPTRVWGYDDGSGASYPGPTIEAFRDAPVQVTWRNDLRDESGELRTSHYLPVDECVHGGEDVAKTVVHLHGGHVAAESDGYPEDAVPPGQELEYDYPNWQDAATLWYHDHALGITRLNVYLGLAGLYLLRDEVEDALDLPSGVDEVPLVIQDRSFNPDGTLRYPATWMEHFHGDTMLVNGRVWPYHEVRRGKVRFRVLNGSGSRTLTLSLSDGAPFHVIGTEGGLLAAPVEVSEISLGPGERSDLVIDFALYPPGGEIVLENSAPAPYPGPEGAGVVRDVMKFVVTAEAGHTRPLPETLRELTSHDEADAVVSRDFELAKAEDDCTGGKWLINGKGWHNIDERPVLGTTEIWRFINRSGVAHPMHMHLVMFRILDRQPFEEIDGVPTPVGDPLPPAPEEDGWKDTVQVHPNEMVRVIARFDDFVGKFPYHCHILEHEDHDMMRQFETQTECGDGVRGLPVEECDEGGETAECDADCTAARCGDGTVNATRGERCDDGNVEPGDGCSARCLVELDAPMDEVEGGCGCRAGGGAGAASWLLVLLALIPWRRRRRG